MKNLKNEVLDDIEVYRKEKESGHFLKKTGYDLTQFKGEKLRKGMDPFFYTFMEKEHTTDLCVYEWVLTAHKEFVHEKKTCARVRADYQEFPVELWYLGLDVNKPTLEELNNLFLHCPVLCERDKSNRLKHWDSCGVWGISAREVKAAWYKSGCGTNPWYFRDILLAVMDCKEIIGRIEGLGLGILPRKRLSRGEIRELLLMSTRLGISISVRLALRLLKLSKPARAYMVGHINTLQHSGGVLGHNRVDWEVLRQPTSKMVEVMPTSYQTKYFGAKMGVPIWELPTNLLKEIGVIKSKREMEFMLESVTDPEDAHYALGLRGLWALFGPDTQGIKGFVKSLEKNHMQVGAVCTNWRSELEDLDSGTIRKLKSLVQKDIRYAHILGSLHLVILELRGNPKSYEEAEKVASSFKYTNVVDRHTALVCGSVGVSQTLFERTQRHVLKAKGNHNAFEALPLNTEYTDEGYTVRFLKRGDAIGLILGKVTNCCQSVGDVGDDCAKAGFKDSDKGFLVIEKGNEIIAQAWVWLDQNERVLVLDSVESKGLSEKRLEKVANLLQEWKAVVTKSFMVDKVAIGVTTYGITGKLLTVMGLSENIRRAYSPISYNGYMDGEAQVLI